MKWLIQTGSQGALVIALVLSATAGMLFFLVTPAEALPRGGPGSSERVNYCSDINIDCVADVAESCDKIHSSDAEKYLECYLSGSSACNRERDKCLAREKLEINPGYESRGDAPPDTNSKSIEN